jgi:hypothetical protein
MKTLLRPVVSKVRILNLITSRTTINAYTKAAAASLARFDDSKVDASPFPKTHFYWRWEMSVGDRTFDVSEGQPTGVDVRIE